MKKIILFLIIIIAITCGCEKYTLNKIYGFYTLSTYTVNGIDSLNLYKDSLGSDFHFFYNDVYYNNEFTITGFRNDNNNVPVVCKWELINNNKTLKILTSTGCIGTGPIGRDKHQEWSILKLRQSYIKLKTNYNEKVYLIELGDK
jgi:hypothetical protein